MKKQFYKFFIFIFVLVYGCDNSIVTELNESATSGPDTRNVAALPAFNGKLVYHNYSSYSAKDSKLWLYDFSTGTLNNISKNWNIIHPMNAHFSPDGRSIVFMGIGTNGSWDIFLYDLSGSASPVNLTANSSLREEDPKYSPDGKKIVFKRDLKLAEMDLSTKKVTMLANASGIEYSMPYYNYDGTEVVCSKEEGDETSIIAVNVKTKAVRELYDEPGVQDYYPINADKNSFYYSRGYSTSNKLDQVYRGFWDGSPSVRLPFNKTDGNYSDAYPVNNEWVIISRTGSGSKGGYDLYLANVNTGSIYSMSGYHSGINTTEHELGAAVYIENPNQTVKNISLSYDGKCYSASVDLVKNQEFKMTQVTNPGTACNRDFLQYNPSTGNFTFTGETGLWNIFYYPEYNYIWVSKWNAVAPEAYWIIGTGFSSAPRWYSAFNSLGWKMDDVRQVAYMKRISDYKYQASVFLSDQTEWGFDIKVYSKRGWSGNHAIFVSNRLTGDKQGMKVAGTDKADIVMDKGFVPGYFLVTVDISSGLQNAVVDFKRIN